MIALAHRRDDDFFDRLRAQASRLAAAEPLLAPYLAEILLDHARFEDALAHLLASRLRAPDLATINLVALARDAIDGPFRAAALRDLAAVAMRDPAAPDLLVPFLYFKGFHALQWHRVAHALWQAGRVELALHLQSRVSESFAIDIHPAARIGSGVFFDHGTGLVIGETAMVEDDVSILQNVTLGGTGKERGDRHPKVRSGVLIGAGAKILGNIEIGRGARVGAGSVVLHAVPAFASVAGVPARIVGQRPVTLPTPAQCMEHWLDGSG
ncbi:MAG: cysE [Rhodospirillales bacterium]|nr:cysE [Rhodospirillales bacterium]